MSYDLPSLDRRLDEIESVANVLGVKIRLRAVWHNDTKGAGYVWMVDCFDLDSDPAAHDDLLARLGNGVAREDGQFHEFEVTHRSVSLSDHFDYDHYRFYADIPSYM